MSNHEPFRLPAVNTMHTLTFRIPMHDAETGESRTAIVTLDKRRLWQTERGAVHGVRVEWENGQGERTQDAPNRVRTPRYGANGVKTK